MSTVIPEGSVLLEDNMPTGGRLSVAALAPLWRTSGHEHIVALLNAPGISSTQSASSFGGAVELRDCESAELHGLGAVPDRPGSADARLMVSPGCMRSVVNWFLQRSAERWLMDMARELREEAMHEGTPIFGDGEFGNILLTPSQVMTTTLRVGELRSEAARRNSTLYLWWLYEASCPAKILGRLQSSTRVLLPTWEQVRNGRVGEVLLSPTITLTIPAMKSLQAGKQRIS